MTLDPTTLPLWLVVIPLSAALLAFLVPAAGRAIVAMALIGAAWPLAELVQVIWMTGSVSHDAGGWRPPLGIQVSVDGSRAFDGPYEHDCNAVRVDEVVDTTGAGDAFAAAFLARHLHGADVASSLAAGAALAAEVVGREGSV